MTTPAKIHATSTRKAARQLTGPTDPTDPTTTLTPDDAQFLKRILASRSENDSAHVQNMASEDFPAVFPNTCDEIPDQLARRDNGDDDFLAAVQNTREIIPEHEIEARDESKYIDDFIKEISRRKVNPDQVAVRDGMDDLVALLSSRDVMPEHRIEARGSKAWEGFKNFLSGVFTFITHII